MGNLGEHLPPLQPLSHTRGIGKHSVDTSTGDWCTEIGNGRENFHGSPQDY